MHEAAVVSVARAGRVDMFPISDMCSARDARRLVKVRYAAMNRSFVVLDLYTRGTFPGTFHY